MLPSSGTRYVVGFAGAVVSADDKLWLAIGTRPGHYAIELSGKGFLGYRRFLPVR